MQIQQVNRDDAEKIFVSYRNVDGSGSITANDAVVLAVDGNSNDGIGATKPAAISAKGWIGIADADLAINGFGRAQIFGFRDSVRISNEGTSITITAGDAIIPVAGQPGLGSVGGVTLAYTNLKYAVIGETITISADGFAKAIIRAL